MQIEQLVSLLLVANHAPQPGKRWTGLLAQCIGNTALLIRVIEEPQKRQLRPRAARQRLREGGQGSRISIEVTGRSQRIVVRRRFDVLQLAIAKAQGHHLGSWPRSVGQAKPRKHRY